MLTLEGQKLFFFFVLGSKRGAALTALVLLVLLFASLLPVSAEKMLGLGRLLQARHEPLHVVKAVVHDFLRSQNTGFYLVHGEEPVFGSMR